MERAGCAGVCAWERAGYNPATVLRHPRRYASEIHLTLKVHIDGGSRGNPGPAGAGVVIRREDGTQFFEAGYFLGHQTNNAAEYHALIRALDRVIAARVQAVDLHSDSELLVKQVTGEYRVKNPGLAPLFEQVQLRLIRAGRWTIRHVRREQNTRADELANLAMDRRADIVVFDAEQGGTLDTDPRNLGHDGQTGTSDGSALCAPAAGPTQPESAAYPIGTRCVRIAAVRAPDVEHCPAPGCVAEPLHVAYTLPAGLCVHAAHALLPTLLGMLNTAPEEFGAIPTMSIRCDRPGCRAEFQLSPVCSGNGQSC